MPEEKFNFTEAYQEVEKINDWFQEENIDLDEALKKFQRGMDLIKGCKERLKNAENKFEEIKKKYSVEEKEEIEIPEENIENTKEGDEIPIADIPL